MSQVPGTAPPRPPMTRRRKLAILATLTAFALIVLGILLESGAWLTGSRAHRQRVYDDKLGWVYRPNTVFQHLSSVGRVHCSINERGFRPTVEGKDGEAPIVVCLGDSYTFGGESPDDKTWPEVLSKELTREGFPARTVNLGITGYSPLQSLMVFRRYLQESPDAGKVRAVIFFFFINDPSDNFDSERPHWDPAEFEEGAPRPPSWTPRHLAPRPPPPFEWRKVPGMIRTRSAFLNGIRSRADGTELSDYKAGGELFIKLFGHHYQKFVDSPTYQNGMRRILDELRRECESRGILLAVSSVVTAPWDNPGTTRQEFAELVGWTEAQQEAQIRSYHAALNVLSKLAGESGAAFLDIRGCLDGMKYREYASSSMDWHYSSAANARVGAAMAARLRPHLAPPPR